MKSRMEKLIGLRKRAEDGSQNKYELGFPELVDKDLPALYAAIVKDKTEPGTDEETVGEATVYLIEAAGFFIGKLGGTLESTEKAVLLKMKEQGYSFSSLKAALEDEEDGLWDLFNKALAFGQRATASLKEEAGRVSEAAPKIALINDLLGAVSFKTKKESEWTPLNRMQQTAPLNSSEPVFVLVKSKDGNEKEYTIGNMALYDVAKAGNKIYRLSGFSNLTSLKDQSTVEKSSGGGGGSPRRSGGGSGTPQTTSGEILVDEAHRGLTGLVDGNDPKFVYTTAQDGSWADYTYDGKPGSRRLDKTFKNWPEVVRQINTFPMGKATKTAPAATTPTTAPTGAEAAKAPVPEGEAAGVQTRRVVSDAVVMNVAKVLTDVYGGATYAGRTLFRNEKGMVRGMMNHLDGVAQSLGVTIGSAEALAQIITPSIRPGLGRFNSASLDGLSERDMEKQYRQELNLIMTAVKNLFDRIGGAAGYQKLLNYQPNFRAAYEAKNAGKAGAKAPVAGTAPAATPAPSAPATPAPSTAAAPATSAPTPAPATGGAPAANAATTAEANDGSSFGKKSSQSSKFKKLAKLRRLRVRGQMEVAIEPSSRLGVSRIS